jgi:hypothetical protein
VRRPDAGPHGRNSSTIVDRIRRQGGQHGTDRRSRENGRVQHRIEPGGIDR